jgi:hypothetical protein
LLRRCSAGRRFESAQQALVTDGDAIADRYGVDFEIVERNLTAMAARMMTRCK